VNLRMILVVLSLLAFLSVSIAGHFYYSSLKESAFQEAERQVAVQAERIKNDLSSYLSENLKSVKALAGLQELGQALSGTDEIALAKANAILDHFRESLDADVCYLMDRVGNTVASSNRNAPDSFVGRNFSFRPYWRQAIRGAPATYMALGVTSGKRGVYYSHPVYRSRGDAPIGVAVIKAPIDNMEAGFRRDFGGIVLLTDPHGVVFLSNRKDWVYHTLWKLSPEEISEIVDSQQFGDWPWEWIGVEARDEKIVVDASRNRYLMYRMDLDRYPGWQVIYLHSLRERSNTLSVPILKVSGSIVLALCVLIGGSVFFLYRKASTDILKRKEAEEALRQSEEQLRSAKEELHRYSRDLERQVGERTREITGILRNTPSVVYIKDKDGRYRLVNFRYEELFGIRNAEIQGKSDHDIFPKEIADQFRENDLRVFAEGHPCQVEERVPQEDGIHIYLSVKFPLYDQDGSVIRVCGISRKENEPPWPGNCTTNWGRCSPLCASIRRG
jgi:PAS domain S-box-containing protein